MNFFKKNIKKGKKVRSQAHLEDLDGMVWGGPK